MTNETTIINEEIELDGVQISKEIIAMLDDEKKRQIEETKDNIKEFKVQIEEFEQKIENLENGNAEDEYDQMLDDSNPIIKIGTLEYYPSNVLKNVDEVVYRIGYSEYIDDEISNIKYSIEQTKDEIKLSEDIIKEIIDRVGK